GFETQTFVWLDGQIEAVRLRSALALLGRRHPPITSRLVEAEGGSPFWQFRPAADPVLQEATLDSAAAQSVLDHAGQLLSTPSDPTGADPIRFHLLHRPDGGDVF